MTCDFSGIQEKLRRTAQNIRDLDGEIKGFLKSGEYRVFSYEDKEVLRKAIQYHKNRVIPPRFSVLAGEIIHHLRSCLDHVVWEFSSESYRSEEPAQIQFPVLEVRPVKKRGGTGYERRVKGISNPAALILIEWLQPYNTSDPLNSPLLIVHKMDIADKHRKVVPCGSTAAIPISMDVLQRYVRYQRGVPGSLPIDLGAELQRDPKIVAQISFKNFGRREIQPVIQGLVELHNFVVMVAGRFDALNECRDPFRY